MGYTSVRTAYTLDWLEEIWGWRSSCGLYGCTADASALGEENLRSDAFFRECFCGAFNSSNLQEESGLKN